MAKIYYDEDASLGVLAMKTVEVICPGSDGRGFDSRRLHHNNKKRTAIS